MSEPRARRPRFPDGFGQPDDTGPLLPWSHVDARMSAALHYWISTIGPDVSPHTRPIGGMWLDRALYCGGSPSSRWVRNVLAEPRVCLNLSEEGDRALILHGRIEVRTCDEALARRLVDVSNAKYGYGQKAEDYADQPILVFHPGVVYAWSAISEDPTRWELESED